LFKGLRLGPTGLTYLFDGRRGQTFRFDLGE